MKQLSDPTLAFIPIARPTFDTELAEQVTAQNWPSRLQHRLGLH